MHNITSTQNTTSYMNKMPWDPVKHLPAMVTVLWLAIFAKPICKAVREKETNYSRVTKAKGAKEAPKDPWPLSNRMFFRMYLPPNCHKIRLSGPFISHSGKTIVGINGMLNK